MLGVTTQSLSSLFNYILYQPYSNSIYPLFSSIFGSCKSRNKMNRSVSEFLSSLSSSSFDMEELMSTSSECSESTNIPFLKWIHTLQSPNRYLVRVDLDYFTDPFNRVDIHLNMNIDEVEAARIYRKIFDDDDELHHGNNDMLIYKAIDYYGLVHSRYIFSPSGFDEVKAKYLKGDYGTCPRHYCNGQNCLPFGESPIVNQASLKMYCPRCKEIYHMRHHVELDGAYFGPYFPSAFLMQFPDLIPQEGKDMPVLKLYGFKVLDNTKYEVQDSNENEIMAIDN